MTQFALVKTNEPSSVLRPLDDKDSSFLDEIATKVFEGETQGVYTISNEGQNIDDLMLSAQQDLILGNEFSNSRLYKVIDTLRYCAYEIVLWYGSEFEDLDCFSNFDDFLHELQSAVRSPSCEAYMHYKQLNT